MKTPQQLSHKLTQEWQQHRKRAERLLTPSLWPLTISIGGVSSRQFTEQTIEIKNKLTEWRSVNIGEVIWQPKQFQQGAEAVMLPTQWLIRSPSEWVKATGDKAINQDFERLNQLMPHIPTPYQFWIVQYFHQLKGKSDFEIKQAIQIAETLKPGFAQGKPLRAISLPGADTKFLERHRSLITSLLSLRFNEQLNVHDLEDFLQAAESNNHWLLVAPLQRGLLPFQQQKIRAEELSKTPLPAEHILLVENQQCLYHLPEVPDTIAILGSGLNLTWLQADWLRTKNIAYWGDIDTWGLSMLAEARRHLPKLTPLLMNSDTFKRYQAHAVVEPSIAQEQPPDLLTSEEKDLYQKLVASDRGRLEQEFIPEREIHEAIGKWLL